MKDKRVATMAVLGLVFEEFIGPVLSGAPAALGAKEQLGVLGTLPASFSGDLPCADCPAIHCVLNLFPDRSFFISMTYQESDEDSVIYDIGSWALSSDLSILVLKGADEEPILFRVVDRNALHKLKSEGRAIESSLNDTLNRSAAFERIEPHLVMHGMFQYMADAGLFTECLTGQRWPVAHEGDNAALEHAYGSVSHQPGEELLVHLEGSVEMRPPMEGNVLQPTLIVNRFIGIRPDTTCGQRFVSLPLEDTPWRLTLLKGEPVSVQDPRRTPMIMLHPADLRITGSGGCNRIMGRYSLKGHEIDFAELARTKMACPEGMETEEAFLEALAMVHTWNVLGRHLELYDEAGTVMARFAAQPPQ